MNITDHEILTASILIVDDQQSNILLLETMLSDAGYADVRSTTRPGDVCALNRRHDFDLILLDLQMPGMDGFEVMQQLKEQSQGDYLPVLVLTAQPSHKLRALQAGARDFISKPFDLVEMQTRIRNMLEVRLLYRRLESHNRKLEQIVHERTAELRESEARFRSLVELASDWYWEQDENGVFTKVSGPALEMLGLGDPEEQAPGQSGARWNADDRAMLDEKLATRRPFLDFVYSRINADGSEQFLQTSGEPKFDESGRFTGYRGIGMDVTGRMGHLRRDGDLERFRQAMDATVHGIFLLDRATMRFVDVNSAACRISGYSRDELLQTGPEKLSGRQSDELTLDYDQLIAGGSGAGAHRIQLLRKDGSLLSVEVHRQASRTNGGWMLVEVVRDLTGVE